MEGKLYSVPQYGKLQTQPLVLLDFCWEPNTMPWVHQTSGDTYRALWGLLCLAWDERTYSSVPVVKWCGAGEKHSPPTNTHRQIPTPTPSNPNLILVARRCGMGECLPIQFNSPLACPIQAGWYLNLGYQGVGPTSREEIILISCSIAVQ